MSVNLRPGPRSYAESMKPEEWADYKRKLQWLQDQENAGVLTRGWKTQVVSEVHYSFPMVSGVLSGRLISPPVLNAVYRAAGGYRKGAVMYDYDTEVELARAARDSMGQQVEMARDRVRAADELYQARLEKLGKQHELEVQRLQAHVESVEREYARLTTELQQAEQALYDYEQELS